MSKQRLDAKVFEFGGLRLPQAQGWPFFGKIGGTALDPTGKVDSLGLTRITRYEQ